MAVIRDIPPTTRRWRCPPIRRGASTPAYAEVSPRDGYAPDGTYQVNVEIAPYLWLAGIDVTAKTARGLSGNLNSGVPSVSKIAGVVTGAFMGAGLVRYGPYFAQLDIDYFAAAQGKTIAPDALGLSRSAHLSASLRRPAPFSHSRASTSLTEQG